MMLTTWKIYIIAICLANNLLFTAGVYSDKDGRIKVEDDDVQDLISSIEGKGKKRGGILGGFFKNAVPEQLDSDGNKFQTLHHIIPNNQITDAVLQHRNNPGLLKTQLEDYVNKDHIKRVIDTRMNIVPRPNNPNANVQIKQTVPNSDQQYKRFDLKPEYHGQFLHSALSWNPNNLVRGPDPKDRSSDPGSHIDGELLKRQNSYFRNAAQPFQNNKQTLENFLNLPPSTPVEWEKQNNKYVVPSYKYTPSSLGLDRGRSKSQSHGRSPSRSRGWGLGFDRRRGRVWGRGRSL